MKKFLAIICASLFFIACGSSDSGGSSSNSGGGSNSSGNAGGGVPGSAGKVTIKYKVGSEEKTKEVALTKAVIWPLPLTKSVNGKKVEGLVGYDFFLNNFDFDEKKLASAEAKQDGQISVIFKLVGPEGATFQTPIKPGTYDAAQPTDPLDARSKSDNMRLIIFEGGKATPVLFSNPKGTVKITSASGENSSGEIDLSDGNNSIKGTFTTTAYKR